MEASPHCSEDLGEFNNQPVGYRKSRSQLGALPLDGLPIAFANSVMLEISTTEWLMGICST